MTEKRHQRFRRNIRRFLVNSALILAGLANAATPAPEAELRSVATEILNVVSSTNDLSTVQAAAESRVAPHFDFRLMTQLAAGRIWKQATPAQQDKLVDEFHRLLVRTYAAALLSHDTSGARITFKPARKGDEEGELLIRSDVAIPGRKPLAIDYRMTESNGQWRVIDVLVENVSLVVNYRDWFASQAREGGIEAVIRALENKNRQIPS